MSTQRRFTSYSLLAVWIVSLMIGGILPQPAQSASDTTRVYLPLLLHNYSAKEAVTITQGPSLQEPRAQHTATRLLNGKILLVGGTRMGNDFLSSVDLFDPTTGTISPAAPLHTARVDHSATLLQDGRVLVIGGYNLPQQWLSDAEVYDPAANTWTVVHPLYKHGTHRTATLMKDGRVLVVAGCYGSFQCTDRVEIFDPRTNSWTDAPSLPQDRHGHTAQLLDDGRVLVVGGLTAHGCSSGPDAMLYDPQANAWTSTGPMIILPWLASSMKLRDGRVLVAGGGVMMEPCPDENPVPTRIAQIYNPASNTWTAAGDLSQPRYVFLLMALPNGQVLAIGGGRDRDRHWNEQSVVPEIDRYNPQTNRWQTAGLLPKPEVFAAGAILPDGRIWLTGGKNLTTYFADTWMIAVGQ